MMVAAQIGSPPRMRGKQKVKRLLANFGRITPAHAGKTPTAKAVYDALQDHPRACGENIYLPPCGSDSKGSPPRMRGKHCWQNSKASRFGITPAHAGKTDNRWYERLTDTDHPRACGENFELALPTLRSGGSPPRMRGKQFNDMPRSPNERITPAHAGKTSS